MRPCPLSEAEVPYPVTLRILEANLLPSEGMALGFRLAEEPGPGPTPD